MKSSADVLRSSVAVSQLPVAACLSGELKVQSKGTLFRCESKSVDAQPQPVTD